MPGCRHCRAAKALLDDQHLAWHEVDLSRFPQRKPEVLSRSGQRTVPQVFFNARHIGGNAELQQLHADGALQAAAEAMDADSDDDVAQAPLTTEEFVAANGEPEAADTGAAAESKSPDTTATATATDARLCALATAMHHPHTGVSIKDRRYHFRRYRTCCVGSAVVDWLVSRDGISRAAAVELGQQLVHHGLLVHVVYEHGFEDAMLFYRFQQDLAACSFRVGGTPTPPSPPASAGAGSGSGSGGSGGGGAVRAASPAADGDDVTPAAGAAAATSSCLPSLCAKPSATAPSTNDAPSAQLDENAVHRYLLNTGTVWSGSARPAGVVANDLRRQILALYDTFLARDGSWVDYDAMAVSPAFQAYVVASAELQRVNVFALSAVEQKAFFINLYNALVIHGAVTVGSPTTAVQRAKFFTRVSYRVGPFRFSCEDIEHGVLRGNARPPARLQKQWKGTDPRVPLALPRDPRIHFALVCGAKSCPPIKLYNAATLDAALTEVAQAFLNDASNFAVDVAARTVTLSMILKWYSGDFGASNVEVLTCCRQWLAPRVAADVDAVVASGKLSVQYFEYDWAQNRRPTSESGL